MADTVPTVIPKYIDKSVYYVTSDEKENSYAIKSTYKGILRLSPNNGASLNEAADIALTDFTSRNDITYKDSINEFLDPGSPKHQLLRISTSDGNFLDMRLNINDVELDNLYVDGILSGKPLEITPFLHNNKNTVLLFGKRGDDAAATLGNNTCLPVHANRQDFSDEKSSNDPLDVINPVNFRYTLDSNKDNASILTAKIVDGKRVFQYRNTSELIEELVQEALMSFCTVPTGSIHFVPVSIAQYKSLIAVNMSLPNTVINHNDAVNDPIVKDFLLCDGRKYYIKDFPELAKVLAGMKISYERLVTVGGKQVWRRFTHVNNYTAETTWFRVPDLRHKFIRSPYLSSDLIDNDANDTGTWNVDNLPTIAQGKDADKHYHFIAAAEYNANCTKSSFSSGDCSAMVLNGMSADMPDNGTQYDLFTTCNSTGRNAHGLENHTPAIHFFTIPNDIDDTNYADERFIPNCGLTSTNIIDTSVPGDGSELNFGVYTDRTGEYNYNAAVYGMETTPEFYACVPVIKI